MLDSRDAHTIAACRQPWSTTPFRPGPPSYALTLFVVIGRRLRRLRVERGVSRDTVAARLGLPVKHIEAHERGKRRIEPPELAAYAGLYGVPLSSLFAER
jgi:DNA-binding XRE family transcriptional regulator